MIEEVPSCTAALLATSEAVQKRRINRRKSLN
jgi:hypothetical protein